MKRFSEIQAFPVFAYIVMGSTSIPLIVMVALTQSRTFSLGWLFLTLPLGLVFNLLCQKTSVTDRDLTVTFGAILPLYRKRIALPKIAAAKTVTYSPVAEYGGWGIRGWGENIALNAHGNQGVRLTLQNGSRVLVGSQRPDALTQALGPKT